MTVKFNDRYTESPAPSPDWPMQFDERNLSTALQSINRAIGSNRELKSSDLQAYLIAILDAPESSLDYSIKNATHLFQLYFGAPLVDVEPEDPILNYQRNPLTIPTKVKHLYGIWRQIEPRIDPETPLYATYQSVLPLFQRYTNEAAYEDSLKRLLDGERSPLYLKTLIKLSLYPISYAYRKEERDALFAKTLDLLFKEKPYLRGYFPHELSEIAHLLLKSGFQISSWIESLEFIRSSLFSRSPKHLLDRLSKLAQIQITEIPNHTEEDVALHKEKYEHCLTLIQATPDIYEEICFRVWQATGEEAKSFIAANPLSPHVRGAIILTARGPRWFPSSIGTPRPFPLQIISYMAAVSPKERFFAFAQLFHYGITTEEHYRQAFALLTEEDQAAVRSKAPMVDGWPACWEIKRAVQEINAEKRASWRSDS